MGTVNIHHPKRIPVLCKQTRDKNAGMRGCAAQSLRSRVLGKGTCAVRSGGAAAPPQLLPQRGEEGVSCRCQWRKYVPVFGSVAFLFLQAFLPASWAFLPPHDLADSGGSTLGMAPSALRLPPHSTSLHFLCCFCLKTGKKSDT